MRIRKIEIAQWRHFVNLTLELSTDEPLVCIVGANGTGKSHLLELIATCAHRLGLSQGIEIPRGDPFVDVHEFLLQFHLTRGASAAIDTGLAEVPNFNEWDRTLTIRSTKRAEYSSTTIEAGGIANADQSRVFAEHVVATLRESHDVHFLSLDADRAYPKKHIHVNEIAQAYEIDWAGPEYTRGRSFRTTTTLYDEWMKYFLAKENQSGTQLMQGMRRAKQLGTAPPSFVDHFESYASSLQKVLPHVLFTGVDSKQRTLLFDTTGLELTFNQLSGGEREIAFLVGQIDRFGLREGLFLLDEPELHLNADLIRTWVSYLTSTVVTGQIWLATHSLEAVEAAGLEATFVLERNDETRKVDSLARLDTRPILSALSRAVGTPAFSISQLLFVFVEGEEGVGERERFRRLSGDLESIRFMECGSCNEVERRVSAVKLLSGETQVVVRVGGIVDRDFRSSREIEKITAQGIFVLTVHEVENFFLQPATLQTLLGQNGRDGVVATDTIRAASDLRAGAWIFQWAMATSYAKSLPDMSARAKDLAKSMTWADLVAGKEGAIDQIVIFSGFDAENGSKLRRIIGIGLKAYERKRDSSDLWKSCEGKQVLADIARSVGFSGVQSHVLASFTAWERDEALTPIELVHFRRYLLAL